MKKSDYLAEEKRLSSYGESLIGKTAQSTLLTELNEKGNKILSPSSKITGFEIVENFQEPVLMVIISGESVYEDTLRNIK